MTAPRISYAQNGEDVRVWRAFREADPRALNYVDVGANEPRHLSITASLYDEGWRGLLIEADPKLAEDLRIHRRGDTVIEMAASSQPGELTFFRVPGTGLGTLDEAEADAARRRGFDVEAVSVRADRLDNALLAHDVGDIHFMSIDVEGAEAEVLRGLSFDRYRPWVLCVEAVLPGTSTPSHASWEPDLLQHDYDFVAFDGVNRWYVAAEHADLGAIVAVPFNAIDAGEHGWVPADQRATQSSADRAAIRHAWQRENILHDIRTEVPTSEYEKQIAELRSALVSVEGSRSWRYSRKVGRVGKAVLLRGRRVLSRLPAPAETALVRRRHLKHVTVNMGHLTDPAFLGSAPTDAVGWISPDGLPPAPGAGYDLDHFDSADSAVARAWIDAGPYDTDVLLDRRTDNHGDELGRTLIALRTRLALSDRPTSVHWAGGNRALFDARCLQTAAFGNRGIGRFARSALLGVRQELGDSSVVLLVDPGLEPLSAELAGQCEQVSSVTERSVARFSVLIEPSPMTASVDPIVPLLHSNARKIAVVFDFIPMHYPTIYLRHMAARVEYAAALDALRLYDNFVCISHLARRELTELLHRAGGPDIGTKSVVAWPAGLDSGIAAAPGVGGGPIVVMTGDEPRKNTFGALAAIGTATAGLGKERDVVVVGMAGRETGVHHWSIAAAMRPGEARTAGRLDEDELTDLLSSASLVVVASFDEGLSLPVIEAVRAGAPVVASDIPAHRELIGSGSFLADPRSPRSLERAIRRHRGRAATHAAQVRALSRHQHESLESAVGRLAAAGLRRADVDLPLSAVYVSGRALSVGIGTPWAPQRSGVADFATATTHELARLCDVTVYATNDGDPSRDVPADVRLRGARIADVYDRGANHDAFVAVLGNSHFHLPFLEVTDRIDSVVVAHDTRMVELYMALRGKGGAEQVMLRGTGRSRLVPELDDQIDDMRLLENAGFWEIARRARMLVMHAPTAAERIRVETGVTPRLLPFANQRVPNGPVGEAQRRDARARLGWPDDRHTIHLASFGFVDVRTKMTDVVVEAAAWLTQWGHRISLHLVGAAGPDEELQILDRAREAGIAAVEVTGFVTEQQFRDHLLAVDLGVQLRISPLLGVSGPLSDLAAFGTPSIASRGLAVDVDTPDYVDRLPDDVSPVMVAEAIERRLSAPIPQEARESMRLAYLDRKSPRHYAEALHELLIESI